MKPILLPWMSIADITDLESNGPPNYYVRFAHEPIPQLPQDRTIPRAFACIIHKDSDKWKFRYWLPGFYKCWYSKREYSTIEEAQMVADKILASEYHLLNDRHLPML